MPRQAFAMGLLCLGLMRLYAECAELRSKLAIKKAECEFYKSILEVYLDGDDKGSKKKEKNKE